MSTHLGTSSGNLRADTPSTMRATSSHTRADSCSVASASGQVHDRTPNGDRLHRQRSKPMPGSTTSDEAEPAAPGAVLLTCCSNWAVTMLDMVTMLTMAESSSITTLAGAVSDCDAICKESLEATTPRLAPKPLHNTASARTK